MYKQKQQQAFQKAENRNVDQIKTVKTNQDLIFPDKWAQLQQILHMKISKNNHLQHDKNSWHQNEHGMQYIRY